MEDSGIPALVALGGDPIAGSSASTEVYGNLDYPSLNNAGQIAFHADIVSNNPTEFLSGIWVRSASGTRLVKRSGDASPGLPSDVNFASVAGPVLNDGCEVAFWSALGGNVTAGMNDQAIWLDGPAGLRLVARTGAQAPRYIKRR